MDWNMALNQADKYPCLLGGYSQMKTDVQIQKNMN